LAVTALETDIVADGLQNPDKLFIEVTDMHRTTLRLPFHKHLGNV
jgi:hypothetical protein